MAIMDEMNGDDINGAPIPAPLAQALNATTNQTTDSVGELPSDAASQESADYARLLESYAHPSTTATGGLIQGHVVKVNVNDVIVDIGHKLEGLVPIEQVKQADGIIPFNAGDPIPVKIDRNGPKQEGYVLLSYVRAATPRAATIRPEEPPIDNAVWDPLDQALLDQTVLQARVTERTKGGLIVDVGVPAFLPGSQLDARPLHDLDQFIGQVIPVKIVSLNRRRRNVVVSRKLAVEGDVKARKAAALEHLSEGAVVAGVVKNLTEFGAFIDLGGVDGLLHVSDLSHGRVTHPSELLHPGDEITVKVLKFDREKERISLGVRQLTPDPWADLPERLSKGSRVMGRVTSVTDYGSFVEIEPGVEGLIHISEMTWSRRMKHPGKIMKPGDPVEAVVLEVRPGDRRVSLGIKQLEADPWTTVADRYSVASVVEGRVRKLADFGVFLEIEDGVDGLVHVSDLAWTKHVKHPSEVVKKGQVVQAVILSIDAPNRRLSLGIKQLQPDAWETFFRDHAVGDIVRGRVCRVAAFGVFVELAPGVEGLCHKSEIPANLPGPQSASDEANDWAPPVGQDYDFKVVRMEEGEKRVALSLRAAAREQEQTQEQTRLQGYQRQAAAATVSLEQAMRARGK